MSDPQAQAPQPSAITVDFYHSPHRRGAYPTPAGILPIRRKQRRGMIDLAAWDAKVAADNAARAGQAPPPAPPAPSPDTIDPTSTADPRLVQAAGERTGEPLGIQTPPELAQAATARPRDPEADDAIDSQAPAQATNRGALAEDAQAIRRNQGIELPPPPTAAGIEAAKAALARQEAEEVHDDEDDDPADDPLALQDAQGGPGAPEGTTTAPTAQPQPGEPPAAGVSLVEDAPAFVPPPPPEAPAKPAAKSTRNRR